MAKPYPQGFSADFISQRTAQASAGSRNHFHLLPSTLGVIMETIRLTSARNRLNSFLHRMFHNFNLGGQDLSVGGHATLGEREARPYVRDGATTRR
ncbi:hypothetical protein ACVJMZ_004393 [Sinorhizobium medicae]